MKITDLTARTLLNSNNAMSQSYIVLDYKDNNTDNVISYKVSLDTLSRAIAMNLNLPLINSNNASSVIISDGSYSTSGLNAGLLTDTERTKLDGIATGAEVNVQANWAETNSSSDAYILNKPTLGTSAGKNYDSSITESSTSINLPTSAAVASIVSPKADKVTGATNGHFAALDGNGNLVDSGYSYSNFDVAGAAAAVNGFDYAVCTTASDTPNGVTFDDVTGTLQASASTKFKIYLVPSINAAGDSYDEYITIQNGSIYSWEKIGNTDIDLSGKTDKVSNAISGNFAALDNNGNLIDSGHKHSDYLTSHQSLADYATIALVNTLAENFGLTLQLPSSVTWDTTDGLTATPNKFIDSTTIVIQKYDGISDWKTYDGGIREEGDTFRAYCTRSLFGTTVSGVVGENYIEPAAEAGGE